MNKTAVVLLVLTAAIGVSHTALAQQNALNILTMNAAKRMGECNQKSFTAYQAKVAGDEYAVVEQMFVLVDACVATAKKKTNLEYQAALNLVKNNPRYVSSLKFYHRYWLSEIGRSRTKGGIGLANDQLKRLEKRIYSGQ